MELKRSSKFRRETPSTVRLPGFVLNLGVHPEGSTLPAHTHDDPTICYVMRGRFTEHWRGHAEDCESESVKVTPAGEVHWDRFTAAETRGLRMDVDRERFADSPSIFRALDERLFSRTGNASDIARRLVSELESDDDTALVAAEGLALELLVELSRDPTPRTGSLPPRWLLEADEFIRESYTRRVTIAEIAQTVSVDPATLARGFRRAFDCTVGDRIRRLRVEHAARALTETPQPLSLIALDAGFYDQPHFTNVFRRYMGMTPAEYRARRS
jgi:AraC family transcriptional regulator